EHPGAISISRNAFRRVEASLEQPGAHLKPRRYAGNCSDAACQRTPERLFLRARRGSSFLQYLPFESKTFALTTFQRGDYPRLFLFHVFLWIDSPVDGEPALLRHDVEVCPPAAPSSSCRQPRGAAFASRLFIGNQRQSNLPVQLGAAFFQRENRVEHGHNPALHIARPTAKQKMVFPRRLELFR